MQDHTGHTSLDADETSKEADAPAEGREPPTEEGGLSGSRQRELERWGSQETETEKMSERGLGPKP